MRLVHDSIRPPRPDMIGEVVFSRRWKELMASPPEFGSPDEKLDSVLRDLVTPATQRDATVAATFVQWLGTNVGSCVLREAERIASWSEDAGWRQHAYLFAWTKENFRTPAKSRGLRPIEFLLTPPGDCNEAGWPRRLPDVTLRDLEVIDHVALWLGSEEGQAFLSACRQEIAAYEEKRRRAIRAAFDDMAGGAACRPAPHPDTTEAAGARGAGGDHP